MSNSVTFSFNINIPINIPANVPCQVSVSFGQPYITYPEPIQQQEPKYVQHPPVPRQPVMEPQKAPFKEATTKVKKSKSLDINWSEDGF